MMEIDNSAYVAWCGVQKLYTDELWQLNEEYQREIVGLTDKQRSTRTEEYIKCRRELIAQYSGGGTINRADLVAIAVILQHKTSCQNLHDLACTLLTELQAMQKHLDATIAMNEELKRRLTAL